VIDAFASGDVTAVCAERAEAGGIIATVVPDHTRLGAMVQACAIAFADRAREFLLAGRQVRVQGRLVAISGQEPVSLSDRERDVLRALARKPSAVVTKAALFREVWGRARTMSTSWRSRSPGSANVWAPPEPAWRPSSAAATASAPTDPVEILTSTPRFWSVHRVRDDEIRKPLTNRDPVDGVVLCEMSCPRAPQHFTTPRG